MERVIIVSADCHVDPEAIDAFGPYLEAKYQQQYRDYVESVKNVNLSRANYFSEQHVTKLREAAKLHSPFAGAASAAAGSSLSRTSDPEVRLKELEADGVVAEVLFVNTPWPFAPQELGAIRAAMHGSTSGPERELEAAGLRAYHRWLGDLCKASPGRRVGIGVLGPVYDIDDTLRELEFMRDVGLGGVMAPPPASHVPHLLDRYYDPVWAKCAELAMPLHVHAGWGGVPDPRIRITNPGSWSEVNWSVRAVGFAEASLMGRRALWLLILGGVLDRHSDLKLVLTELHSDWVSTCLTALDYLYDNQTRSLWYADGKLPMRPSEYWNRQCFVGASSISRAEVELRRETGLQTMMFGTDYPHNEGTWPTTISWLKRVLEGIPQADVRQILGENAIRCYDLDLTHLSAAAERCGPSIEELTGGTGNLDGEMIAWLDDRGAGRPAAFI
jgi:predicted TIM-barrel fold metal-dependent hydrolase